MRVLIVTLLALVMGGCAGTVPWNPQGYAGVTEANIKAQCGDKVTWCPQTVSIVDGKEKQDIRLTFQTPDGTKTSYVASDVAAFEGQQVRAAVEEAVSEDAKEATPGIVDTITDAIIQLQ